MSAKGIHEDNNFKLGKDEPKTDAKTLKLTEFIDTTIQVPVSHDFDKHRRPFVPHAWGNHDWGDCVDAAQANQLVRLERVETRRTPKLTDQDVIDRYKKQTGAASPGDANDNGLVMLNTLREWRAGWAIDNKNYNIAAFGKIPTHNHQLLRTCSYLFNGLQLGFDLPITASLDTHNGAWITTSGQGSEPGTWGGHAVYSKKFDADNLYVITWGREVRVSNDFIDKYCDEAWTVIDDFDQWRHTHGVLDVPGLIQKMRDNGITVNI